MDCPLLITLVLATDQYVSLVDITHFGRVNRRSQIKQQQAKQTTNNKSQNRYTLYIE